MLPGELDDHRRREQELPRDVRSQVLERDNRQCQICGTTGENILHLHHWKDYRSQGGGDEPENLVTLCFVHHEAVHLGRWDISLKCIKGRWTSFTRRIR